MKIDPVFFVLGIVLCGSLCLLRATLWNSSLSKLFHKGSQSKRSFTEGLQFPADVHRK